MTTFAFRCKSFLQKVIRERIILIRMGKSKLPNAEKIRLQAENYQQTLERINAESNLARFIQENKDAIRALIPSRKKAYLNEFTELISQSHEVH